MSVRTERVRYRIRDVHDSARWKLHLGRLFMRAWLHRHRQSDVCYVGITGSAGKTTAKDLSAAVLSQLGPTVSTPRSRNRSYATAEQILELRDGDRFCIMEMGASKPGALDWPMRLVRPDIGVLTLVQRDHYRAFKSIQAIADEKGKLIENLAPDGIAVLNIDDELVKAIGERCTRNVIWVGKDPRATLRLLEVRSSWPDALHLTLEYQGRRFEVPTKLHGKHLALSVMSALGVGLAAGIPLERAIEAVSGVSSTEGRMQIVEGDDGVVFLRDDWKAPDWSAQAVLDFVRDADAPRKIAVIGSLSDFSGDSSRKYKQFARKVRDCVDLAVFVGPNAYRALRARSGQSDLSLLGFQRLRDAAAYLNAELRPGDLVLLKGSAKTDHLARVMLDRYRPVQCWLDRCGREYFCTQCSRLYATRDHGDAEHGPQ